MHLSHQSISRFGFEIVCTMCFSTVACTASNQSSSTNPTARLTSATASPATQKNNKVQGNPKQQFTAIVGTQQDGWLPKVLAGKGLKKGLTPAQAGKIIPGAEQVSDYGFSKVTVKDVPGLKQYEFYYTKIGSAAQLESVRLTFDPMLNQAYPDLVKVLSSKYGAANPEDVKKQMIVWVNPDFLSAQLTKQVTDLGAYELNVSLEKE